MIDPNLYDEIQQSLPARPKWQWKNLSLPAVFVIAVVIVSEWPKGQAVNLDYALFRAMRLAADCVAIPTTEIRLIIERRIGKPIEHFTAEDQLVALDHLFDSMQVRLCISGPS